MTVGYLYTAISLALMGMVLCFGAPSFPVTIMGASLAIALTGVPHGGLDHWTGRQILAPRFPKSWWIVFFPSYLAIGAIIVVVWSAAPVIMAVGFFVLSAWHFGREEEESRGAARCHSGPNARRTLSSTYGHLSAVAIGGLVIWIPALLRPQEMAWLVRMLVASNDATSSGWIVTGTRWIAIVLVPLALAIVALRLRLDSRNVRNWIPMLTIGLSIVTPILISFTVYFCAWHSILGLQRLQQREGLSLSQFSYAVAPLSTLAILGILMMGWFYSRDALSMVEPEWISVKTLFIGLSAIAVPHILLHEVLGRAEHEAVPMGVLS
jgi:Brp/Blh family beta-carotene 15,15'-monooxygenase